MTMPSAPRLHQGKQKRSTPNSLGWPLQRCLTMCTHMGKGRYSLFAGRSCGLFLLVGTLSVGMRPIPVAPVGSPCKMLMGKGSFGTARVLVCFCVQQSW
jgi:hypothetical protein